MLVYYHIGICLKTDLFTLRVELNTGEALYIGVVRERERAEPLVCIEGLQESL